jgi:hypothetical protein
MILVLGVATLWGGLLVVWGVGNVIRQVVTYEFTALDAVWLYVALAGVATLAGIPLALRTRLRHRRSAKSKAGGDLARPSLAP